MRIHYDPDVDILTIDLVDALHDGPGATRFEGGTYIDIDVTGKVWSIEIQAASKKYPLEELLKYPSDYEEPIPLTDAARVLGLTTEAVKKAIVRGRLRGKKVGRNWTTTIAAVTDYGNERALGRSKAAQKTRGAAESTAQAREKSPRKVSQ
jgi:uncharacterized protein YuzE